MVNLVWKLKRVKSALRTWNKDVFGRVENHISSLKEKIETLEDSLQVNYSYDFIMNLISTSAKLDCWLNREEMRMMQEAKQMWRCESDCNSSFFHAVVAQRRK